MTKKKKINELAELAEAEIAAHLKYQARKEACHQVEDQWAGKPFTRERDHAIIESYKEMHEAFRAWLDANDQYVKSLIENKD